MTSITRSLSNFLASLPVEQSTDSLPAIQQIIAETPQTVVVLDDDPTGTQTVYDIPVLTEWSVDVLVTEFQQKTPFVYILTNSRSLTQADAQTLATEIGHSLAIASKQTGQPFTVISRSDSTLRGHFPSEVDALTDAIGEQFDNILLIPAFFEGGRYTIGDVHYVARGDELVPAGETEYAQDASFGYSASNLCEWVAEKTASQIAAEDVATISLNMLREQGADSITATLLELSAGQICVINAASYHDLEVATLGILQAEQHGKRFIYRTAASFVRTRAGLPEKALLTADNLNLAQNGAGLIIVGSYVSKSSGQLAYLLNQDNVVGVEIRVGELLVDAPQLSEIERVSAEVNQLLQQKHNTVLYTSRELITGASAENSLEIGQRISKSIVRIIQNLSVQPRYVLAKGGITSSDIATKALGIKRALVRGQILPGIPVWEAGHESRFSGVPYIIFPGNVGADDALATIVQALATQGA